MTTSVEHSIVIDQPVNTVYNQWTQFEDFPLFMGDIEKVEQVAPDELVWQAKIRGAERTWRAKITEQTPDQRIAWTTTDGPKHGGVVTFHKLDDNATKVMYQMDMEPEGLAEHYADKVGLVESRVKDDLEGFKEFIEKRGRETGAWRGTIRQSA